MAKLQLKRGSQATLTGAVFDIGEPIYCKDTKDYRIGDGVTAWENLKPHVKEAPSDNKQYVRKNADWEEVSVPSGALADASGSVANDGKYYARKDGSWAEVVASGGSGIADAPTDNKIYGRQNASWVEVTSSGRSTGSTGGVVGYETIVRESAGNVTATTYPRWIAPAAGVIDRVMISLNTLPVGQNVKVDVRKNGAATTNSIFTDDTPMEIATDQVAENGTYTTYSTTNLDNEQVSFEKGDVIYVTITQVGSTTPGADFLCMIGVQFTDLYIITENSTWYASVADEVTLPSAPTPGETLFEYIGTGTNWVIHANPGQYIRLLTTESVSGGSLSSTTGFDCTALIYIGDVSGHNTWLVKYFTGIPEVDAS